MRVSAKMVILSVGGGGRKLNYVYACTVKSCDSEKVKITAVSYIIMYNIYDLAVFGCNTGVIYTRTLKNTLHSKKYNE
jgi:hypothetical protein